MAICYIPWMGDIIDQAPHQCILIDKLSAGRCKDARMVGHKDGNGSDMHGNGFGYLGYPSSCFLLVSIP